MRAASCHRGEAGVKLPLRKIAEFISATSPVEIAASAVGEEIAQAYSIDSRTIRAGELFFAVKGERFDGHDFVSAALENGAAAAVVRQDQWHRYSWTTKLLVVDDTLIALQTLATAVRKVWGKPLVGVTGSAGKTTTKEAIAHVLSSRFRVLKSEGNFNNHFGLPLMLLKIEPEHDVAVIEMGMSHAGEIRALAKIAQPEIGVVTNVAPVHLEFFDSLAGIARAKYELVESLPANGTAILNADDEYVSQFGRGFKGKVISYGLRTTADVRAENVQSNGAEGSRFDVITTNGRESAILPLVGEHNVLNALAAMKATRRIVVAGEMLELGPSGEELHRAAGQHLAEKKIEVLVGVRGLAQAMVDGARSAGTLAEFVTTPEEAGESLARESRDGDIVLLKASRGVKLEKALETWKSKISG